MIGLRGEGDLLLTPQIQMTIAETHELIMPKVAPVTVLETVVLHLKMMKAEAGAGVGVGVRLQKSLASATDLCNAICQPAGAGETLRLFPQLSRGRSKRPLTGLIVKI